MQLVNFIDTTNPAIVVGAIHALTTGSFEKKFKDLETSAIVNAFAIATYGLTLEQVNLGVKTILDKAFCPDPALFRQWCLGNADFSFDDEIADSYIDKHGALGHIIDWLADSNTAISQAEKHAYDETCNLWNAISSDSDRIRAELAFKDNYAHIVKDLVKQRTPCQPYIAPIVITHQADKKRTQAEIEAGKKAGEAFFAQWGGR